MDFEWDAKKDGRNRSERGFGFDLASLIFEGRTLERVDVRVDCGEVRVEAIGEVDGDVLVVIYTDRGDVRRIISARMADKQERKAWAAV